MKRTTVIGLVLFALLLWGLEHCQRKLWEPDEARYAYVAKEMMRDGHWAVPHRHGEYYAHKPPLYFWMIRGASKLAGGSINGVTARLPSLLATIVSLLVTGLFALKLFGKKAVWPSMLVLATSFLFWQEGGMGRMDSVLLALELSALYLLIKGDERKSDALRAAGYVCMGLGILAKGPVGFLVPFIAYLVMRKTRGERAFSGHIGWGIPLVLLFPLIWLGAAWAEGAPVAYFKELIFKQNFGRVAGTDNFGKPRPFYFYLLHMPAEFMPWTVFLPASIAALRRSEKKMELKVLLGWALSVIVFFTLSSGKRNLYVLLAYPAMSLMVGGASSYVSALSKKWQTWAVVTFAGIMILMGIAEASIGLFINLPFNHLLTFPPAAVLLVGAGAILGVFTKKGFGRTLICVCAGIFAVHYALVANLVYPALNTQKTPVDIVESVRPYSESGESMIIYGTTSEIFPLYCDMRSLCADDPDMLMQKMADEHRGVIVFRDNSWQELAPLLRRTKVIGECDIGHKKMVLVHFDKW